MWHAENGKGLFMTTTTETPHPAKFNDRVLDVVAEWLPSDRYSNVLDPFAGVGKIHQLPNTTTGIEIELEWVQQTEPGGLTWHGNCLTLMEQWLVERGGGEWQAIASSPCYGNRMADCHDAQDGSRRVTYRHMLGRELSAGSSASMQWGPIYCAFHQVAWQVATQLLDDGGRFVLNIKNHIREGVEQRVTEWHMNTIMSLGFELAALVPVVLPGMRYGANAAQRTPHEYVVVFDRKVP